MARLLHVINESFKLFFTKIAFNALVSAQLVVKMFASDVNRKRFVSAESDAADFTLAAAVEAFRLVDRLVDFDLRMRNAQMSSNVGRVGTAEVAQFATVHVVLRLLRCG